MRSRISSMSRGHASCAAACRCCRRTRYEASGRTPRTRRAPRAAAAGPPNRARPSHAPRRAASTAVTAAKSRARTSPRPACTSQSCARGRRRAGATVRGGPARQAAPAEGERGVQVGSVPAAAHGGAARCRSPRPPPGPRVAEAPGPHGRRRGRVEQAAGVVAGVGERPARPDRQLARPGQRPVGAGPAEHLGDRELRGLGAARQVLDGQRPRSREARAACAAQCTTTSMLSATSVLSAASGTPPAVSASWQMNRSRVSAWRADPAWMVV